MALFASLAGAAAIASPINCQGTVLDALLYADGSVNIRGSWRSDFTFVCNTNGTFGGVATEVCLSWYATAVKAISLGKTLQVYYNTTYTCATLPTYGSSPVPVYIGMNP
jgi:hypothetical protein